MNVSNVKDVRKWGGSTTDAILDPSCLIFRTPGIDGLIGYRDENKCAIVFGDPVCPPNQIEKLIQSFQEFCTQSDLKIIYLIVSEEFSRLLIQNGYCKTMIEYGEELSLNPHEDPREKEGVHASLVRRKVRHALSEGVTVIEYKPFDEQIENGIILVGKKWLKARKGPQIHFSHVHSFENREGKRWFYAEKEGEIVAVVILNRIEQKQGWLLNHLMFTPEAPHGVPELLIVKVLEVLSKEGCRYVTFGTVPAREIGEIVGLGAFSTYLAKFVYRIARVIYHLDGKKKFWEKFYPQSKKAFLLFKDSHIGLQEIIALKKALNATLRGFDGNN